MGEEVSKAAIWMGRLSTFFKVLGAVGLVITIIAGIIELVEGAEQYVTLHRLSRQLRCPLTAPPCPYPPPQEGEADRRDPRAPARAPHDRVFQAGGREHLLAARHPPALPRRFLRRLGPGPHHRRLRESRPRFPVVLDLRVEELTQTTRLFLGGQIANKLIKSITDENDAIDLDQLETDLETQDRTSSLFYGDDDLSHDEVVATASMTN